MVEIGFDVGGTFVDVGVRDRRSGAWHTAKVLIGDSAESAVLEAIDVGLELAGAEPAEVSFLAHGTTIATNIVIEERGARVGLITTRGFRDVLEIGRQNRPSIYDQRVGRPPPLARRAARVEVDERINAKGEISTPLDVASVDAAIDTLRAQEVECVAVCLLHSWINPSHERLVAARVAERWPGPSVVLSSSIAPQYREYERTSTTVLSAYIEPALAAYVAELSQALEAKGVPQPLWVMQSSGGLGSIGELVRRPLSAQASGPAAGVVGAIAVADTAAVGDFVTLDVGGTSTDVALVMGGRPESQRERELRGQPVIGNSIAVQSIGAGGGSIAWIDPGGLLKVGPRSAGAQPGPACYGRGGTKATVTDAHVLLGYIDPDRTLGRDLRLDGELARDAIARLADQLGLALEEVARGIIDVTTASVIRALRRVTIERGHDPRELALVAYGGGGPLYANVLIDELGMSRALIPPAAGVLSSVGLLSSSPRVDLAQTWVTPMDGAPPHRLVKLFAELEAEGQARMVAQGYGGNGLSVERELDLRYVGQSHVVSVPLGGLGDRVFAAAVDEFHDEHERLFGVSASAEPVESVTAHVAVIDRREPVCPTTRPAGATQAATRSWQTPRGAHIASVHERDALSPGEDVSGPALVDSGDTTVAILPGYLANVHENGLLEVRRER